MEKNFTKTLEKIQNDAYEKQWSFPRILNALVEAGVDSYSVTLGKTYGIVFDGSFGKSVQNDLPGYHPLTIASHFSAEEVKKAVENHALGKTDYIGFLADIAKAGVSHYCVQAKKRSINYYNVDEKQCYTELVLSEING